MAAPTVRASQAIEDLALMAGSAIIGSLTIPGRAENVREARAFVAKALSQLPNIAEAAVLLTSELVSNAVIHSNSCRPGGTIRLLIAQMTGGIRVEVTDDGSELGAPSVKGDVYASDGHGLFLVQSLADQWGYLRDETGTTVWFWLSLGRETG